MANFKVARSEIKDAVEAAKNIREQLAEIDACLVLYFVASPYPADVISKEMASVFAGVQTVGCTTAGEMISGDIGHNSVVAMAFGKEALNFLKVEVLENIKENTAEAVKTAFASFEKSLGVSMKQADPSRYVGMLMVDGLTGCEEALNDQLGNHTNVPFIGGSAADDFKFQNTWLFVDGKTYNNAAVLLLMEPANGYVTLKTQSFSITDKKLTPTKVDESRRMVIEFDGKPALEAYSEATGVSQDELQKTVDAYSVGLIFDENNYFVRNPKQVEGTSIVFHCLAKEGLELSLLKPKDIVAVTRADLKKCGPVQAVVDFNCAGRFNELTWKKQLKDYSEIFSDVPAIGFATYGESYIGHMNQTSTMLLLK